MAVYKMNEGFSWTAPAAADLTGKLNLFMALAGDGTVNVCGSGIKPFGTLYEEAKITQPATIQFMGVAKVISGAAVACGAGVQSDAAGKAITLAAGQRAGMALAASTGANQVIPVALGL